MAPPATATAPPQLAVGDVTITALIDMDLDFPLGLDQVFPGVTAEQWDAHRDRCPEAFGTHGGWRYVVTCYLVRPRSGRLILVDTGCGPATLPFPGFLGVDGAMGRQLAALGVTPEEIDTVLLTHVHPDHVGGAGARRDGAPVATFPRARYLLPRADWDTWRRPEVQDAFPFPFVGDTLLPLMELGRVDLLDGEVVIDPELTLSPTPGHTPGSSSLYVRSAGETAVLVGDVWLHPAQVTEPTWGCGFDMDMATATATRAALAERIADEGMTMGACHLPAPFGQIVRLEGRHHWLPLKPPDSAA
jgi:glyoxylase-like metal-dependent hydrolase (beta-lactamase superfamily II)